MTNYLEYPVADAVMLAKNRRGVLVGFGIAAIAMGVLCVLGAGVAAYSMVSLVNSGFADEMRARFIAGAIVGALVMLAFASGFVWGGIAMIRCRRWVAPLGWSAAVAWLILGLLSVEEFLVSLASYDFPRGVEIWGGLAIMAVFGVVLPAAYAIVFTRAGVQRTLEAYHPYPVWTDRYPRPVLAVGVWCALLSAVMLAGAPGMSERFFGHFVTSLPAVVAVALGWAALLAGTAVLCMLRPRIGWWFAFGALTLYVTSIVLTDWLGDPRRIYGPQESPGAVSDETLKSWRITRINHTIVGALCWIGGAGYLVRRRAAFGGEMPVAGLAGEGAPESGALGHGSQASRLNEMTGVDGAASAGILDRDGAVARVDPPAD